MWRETTRDEDPAPFEVDVEHAGVDERERDFRIELEDVVTEPRLDRGHAAELAAALLLDGDPDELERVVLVLARLRQLRARDAQLGSARHVAVKLDHGPPTGAFRRDHRRRLSLDPQGRALGEPLLVLARVLDEERPVQPVRLAHAPDPDELSHSE